MRSNSRSCHRRSVRLQGFDYSRPGAYFVTVCTQNRAPLFGGIVRGTMHLNRLGQIAADEWARTRLARPHVTAEAFVVMPDHVHGIILIADDDVAAPRRGVQSGPAGPASGSVGAIVGQFKSLVTKRINAVRQTPGAGVWQRGYYEHVIGDEASMNRICRYIAENPARWGATHSKRRGRSGAPLGSSAGVLGGGGLLP
jgi:putative transposase